MLVLALAFATVAWAATVSKPTVRVTRMSPTVVTGTGFQARERVAVTVSAKTAQRVVVVANVAGRFVARFAGFTIPRCTAYAISARGNKGSVASWKVTPDCAAPQGGAGPTNPGTEEPAAMFPTDPIPKKR